MKDFLFVDTVSGTPLRTGEKVYAPPGAKRGQKSGIVAVLVVLIAFIVLLATWAFS